MAGSNNWRIPANFEDWMRNMEKRVVSIERRPVVQSAKDVMGPSLGPWAVNITDLDSDVAAQNGMWYSGVGATNTPDIAYGWMGWTVAQSIPWGIQVAVKMNTSAGALASGSDHRLRRFLVPGGHVGRIYGVWEVL